MKILIISLYHPELMRGGSRLAAYELFELGNVRTLADTLRRARTGPGLWERLAQGIIPPATHAQMVAGYLKVHAGAALA